MTINMELLTGVAIYDTCKLCALRKLNCIDTKFCPFYKQIRTAETVCKIPWQFVSIDCLIHITYTISLS